MEISDLLDKLKALQIEQNKIIEEISTRHNPEAKEVKSTEDPNKISIGDHVQLLTGGLKCKRGDIARVTSISPSSISFVVLRNNHRTYRKPKNIQKVKKTK